VAGALLDSAVEMLPMIYGTTQLSARVSQGNTASIRALIRRSFVHQGHVDGLDLYARR
jgi:RimJ/RimL family protein N-acetyltransferase